MQFIVHKLTMCQSQRLNIATNLATHGTWTITAPLNSSVNLCITIVVLNNVTTLQKSPCNNSIAQQYSMARDSKSGAYFIKPSSDSKLCWDTGAHYTFINGTGVLNVSRTVAGTQMQILECAEARAQLFYFVPISNHLNETNMWAQWGSMHKWYPSHLMIWIADRHPDGLFIMHYCLYQIHVQVLHCC